MTSTTHPEIVAAAQRVAIAKVALDQMEPLLRERHAAVAQITDRMADAEERKQAVLLRRRTEGAQPDDAGRLTIIEADIGDLTTLRSEAMAAVATVEQDRRLPLTEYERAQQDLRDTEATIEFQQLVEHLGKLDAAMGTAVAKFNELHQRRGSGRPIWGPSDRTWFEMRKIRAVKGGL